MTSLPPRPERPAVLVCEGDRDLRLALSGLLRRAGHPVQLAGDVHQALSAAMSVPLSCIVLSLPLPGGGPEEILHSLRGLPGGESAPLILIGPPDVRALEPPWFEPGRDRRLPPTFRPEDLAAAVEKLGTAPSCYNPSMVSSVSKSLSDCNN